MSNRLVLAGAGAGKSRMIVNRALENSHGGLRVLILTYTEGNQKELLKRLCDKNDTKPANVTIKGWFTFLLEDMIRPYQSCIFQDRINSIYFNTSDPHKKNGKTIAGRTESIEGGRYNPRYFLTGSQEKAHTAYLSKLAYRILQKTAAKPIDRLTGIYNTVFIDEIQDLVGWDYEIIEAVSRCLTLDVLCVGDFRQTIYSTSVVKNKDPQSITKKVDRFVKLGFQISHRNSNWRSIQSICCFADLVHTGTRKFPPAASKIGKISAEWSAHLGVFVVREKHAQEYLDRYDPVLLRANKSIGTQYSESRIVYNFGKTKGLGFRRIFILSTAKHRAFLSGDRTVFSGDKTEEARNKLYVAITRARYSVAFLYDGTPSIEGVQIWVP